MSGQAVLGVKRHSLVERGVKVANVVLFWTSKWEKNRRICLEIGIVVSLKGFGVLGFAVKLIAVMVQSSCCPHLCEKGVVQRLVHLKWWLKISRVINHVDEACRRTRMSPHLGTDEIVCGDFFVKWSSHKHVRIKDPCVILKPFWSGVPQEKCLGAKRKLFWWSKCLFRLGRPSRVFDFHAAGLSVMTSADKKDFVLMIYCRVGVFEQVNRQCFVLFVNWFQWSLVIWLILQTVLQTANVALLQYIVLSSWAFPAVTLVELAFLLVLRFLWSLQT